MLSNEQIIKNKARFIEIVQGITRNDTDMVGLLSKLENSDFFTAPASTQYHCSYEGGLCEHSLNVYDTLIKLVGITFPKDGCPITSDSIKIVALFHDISKMNFYETSTRNVKDSMGNWQQVPFIKTRDAKDRFIYGSHGVNSEYMIGKFIPLTLEESMAIINHMGGLEKGGNGFDSTITEVYNKSTLAALLHLADMYSTYVLEKI